MHGIGIGMKATAKRRALRASRINPKTGDYFEQNAKGRLTMKGANAYKADQKSRIAKMRRHGMQGKDGTWMLNGKKQKTMFNPEKKTPHGNIPASEMNKAQTIAAANRRNETGRRFDR